METVDGIEMQFAVNVLAYFWMMEAFTPVLSASAPARIVNVASYWAGDLDLDDLEMKERSYSNNTAYRQSKQADRMLTAAFAARLRESGITVNACHSGDVNSKLSNDLGFGGGEQPADGADTPLWLALDSKGGVHSGAYFEHRAEVPCRFAADADAVDRLYAICAGY